jgi:hypothetical protein
VQTTRYSYVYSNYWFYFTMGRNFYCIGEVVNIFYLDECPKLSAEYLCDCHVIKMILESAQILSTAHVRLDDFDYSKELYKPTHENHPCTKWAMCCDQNYEWLVDHFWSLCLEYYVRYNKQHKSSELYKILKRTPTRIPHACIMTTPALAMPDEYKLATPVESYRNYYGKVKSKLKRFKYTKRSEPYWLKDYVA